MPDPPVEALTEHGTPSVFNPGMAGYGTLVFDFRAPFSHVFSRIEEREFFALAAEGTFASVGVTISAPGAMNTFPFLLTAFQLTLQQTLSYPKKHMECEIFLLTKVKHRAMLCRRRGVPRSSFS